jgi:Ser/Thr protein kinase RdoA (MazF antagonist)
MMAHPYQVLTPSVVLDALSGLGLAVDGRLSALSSYENRVYLAHLDDNTSVVAKFYRPGRWSEAQIREEHSFTAELVAEDIPVVGPLVLNSMSLHEARVVHDGVDGHFWFSVSPRRGGRAPELDDPEVLMWIGRLMARMHLVGERHAFSVRPVLNLHTFGEQSREQLVSQQQIAEEVQQQWLSLCDQALALVQQQMPQDLKVLRLHGDCHPGNILWTPESMPEPGPHFVDMDDARTGPAVQDLWMLVHGDIAERRQRMEIVLEGYESVRGFDRRELQCIEPLRTLRIIHYSAWLAGRQDDPAFPLHFPWFGTSDYWRGQCDTLREQVEAMESDAIVGDVASDWQ